MAAGALAGCDFFSNPGRNPTAGLEVVAGDGQTAPAGTELPERLVVRALDAEGRGLPGQAVTFTVADGGGTVSDPAGVTDDNGVVSVAWTLGTTAGGAQRVEARVGEGDDAAIAAFTATAVPGDPVKLTKAAGDGQVAAPGEQLPNALVARLVDRFGNGIAGRTVAWEVSSGTVSPEAVETEADGSARTTWRLGHSVGSYSATASHEGVESATFSAGTSLGGVTLAKTGGDGQAAPAGATLPAELVVTLRGPSGQPIEGAPITWTPAAGSGTVSPGSSTTNGAGEARARWTMPATIGAVTLTANAGGQATATFTATAQAGAPASITIVSGNGQAGNVGAPLTAELVVAVRDAAANPVAGATVTWTVTAGGGTAAPAPGTTGPDGTARVTWTLGLKADVEHGLSAAAGGSAVAFTATPLLPPSLALFKTGGDAQTGVGGVALPDSLEVTARLADGRAVEGVRVTWSASHGGAIVPRAQRTAPDGKLRARWTVGTTTGSQTAVARWLDTHGAVQDSVAFTATVRAGSAATIAVQSGSGQAGDVGAALPDSLAVIVRDATGNPVPGAAVTWAVTAGGGAVAPSPSTTNAAGIARTRWTLGLRADITHTVTAAAGGVPGQAQFTATPTVPASMAFTRTGGEAQTAVAGTVLPDSLEVTAKLADGRAVEGVRVTWSTTGGTIAPRAERTAADGRLRARWTLGPAAGPQSAVARWLNAQGAAVDSVTFTATATAPPGAPRQD